MFEEGCMVTVPNINSKAYALLKWAVHRRKKELKEKIARIEEITDDDNEYVESVLEAYKDELKICEYIVEYLWYYEKDLRAKEEDNEQSGVTKGDKINGE